MDGANPPFNFRSGDVQLALGNNPHADSVAFTWDPPDKNDKNEDNHNPSANLAIVHPNVDGNVGDDSNEASAEGNDRKRRRVHVEIDNHRITVLKLGSDIAFDFKSIFAESEKKLANTVTERDESQAQLANLIGIRDNLQLQHDDLKRQRDWYYAELQRVGKQHTEHNTLRTKHEAALAQNARLENKLEASKANFQDLLESSCELASLKRQHMTLKKTHHTLKKDYATLQEQHAELKADFEGKEQEWEQYLGSFRMELDLEYNFQDRAEEAENEVRRVGDEMNSLRREQDRVETERFLAEERLRHAKSDLQEANEEIQNLKNKLDEKKAAEEYVRVLENKVETEAALAADYASQLHQLQGAADRSAAEDITKSKLEVKELQDKNAAKDIEITALKAALKEANKKCAWADRLSRPVKKGLPRAADNIKKESPKTRARGRRSTDDAIEENSAEEVDDI